MVGLPFWLVIGVVAGVTNVVPLIGPFVAGLLGVTVALVTEGVGLALVVFVVLVVIQQVDSHVVSPLVVGRTVRIHPLLVLLAVLVGGTLSGILGMLVAVPTAAALKVLIAYAWRRWAGWDDTAACAGRRKDAVVHERAHAASTT